MSNKKNINLIKKSKYYNISSFELKKLKICLNYLEKNKNFFFQFKVTEKNIKYYKILLNLLQNLKSSEARFLFYEFSDNFLFKSFWNNFCKNENLVSDFFKKWYSNWNKKDYENINEYFNDLKIAELSYTSKIYFEENIPPSNKKILKWQKELPKSGLYSYYKSNKFLFHMWIYEKIEKIENSKIPLIIYEESITQKKEKKSFQEHLKNQCTFIPFLEDRKKKEEPINLGEKIYFWNIKWNFMLWIINKFSKRKIKRSFYNDFIFIYDLKNLNLTEFVAWGNFTWLYYRIIFWGICACDFLINYGLIFSFKDIIRNKYAYFAYFGEDSITIPLLLISFGFWILFSGYQNIFFWFSNLETAKELRAIILARKYGSHDKIYEEYFKKNIYFYLSYFKSFFVGPWLEIYKENMKNIIAEKWSIKRFFMKKGKKINLDNIPNGKFFIWKNQDNVDLRNQHLKIKYIYDFYLFLKKKINKTINKEELNTELDKNFNICKSKLDFLERYESLHRSYFNTVEDSYRIDIDKFLLKKWEKNRKDLDTYYKIDKKENMLKKKNKEYDTRLFFKTYNSDYWVDDPLTELNKEIEKENYLKEKNNSLFKGTWRK